MNNLCIIGLPGCGKTSVGKYLAEKLNMPFVDSDEEIAFTCLMPITDIFAEMGEEGFRKIETAALKEILQKEGQIVSLGGGIVVKEENRNLLKKEKVLFLDPAIEYEMTQKEISERPVSQKKSLRQLKEERQQLYLECADRIIHEETMDAVYEKALKYAEEVYGISGNSRT